MEVTSSEFGELGEGLGELVEEDLLRLGVTLDMRLEAIILDEHKIGRKHHQLMSRFILKLLGVGSRLLDPLVVQEGGKEGVGELVGSSSPRSVVTRAILVTLSKSVSSREGDDLLIVQTHLVKDGTKMIAVLGGIRETTSLDELVLFGGVLTTSLERHVRTASGLNSNISAELPEVSISNIRVLVLDGLDEVTSDLETRKGQGVAKLEPTRKVFGDEPATGEVEE